MRGIVREVSLLGLFFVALVFFAACYIAAAALAWVARPLVWLFFPPRREARPPLYRPAFARAREGHCRG